MIKKTICLILFLSFLSSIAFAEETLYEKKLEYKRKKIEILVRSTFVGTERASSSTDIFETTYTPEASTTYKYGYITTEQAGTKMIQEVKDWIIVRGGIRELSDVEFLQLTGYQARAKDIGDNIDSKNNWLIAAAVVGIGGVAVMVSGASQGDSGTATAGGLITLCGILISSFNAPQRHYIAPDFAQEATDNYNIALKKSLGLPVETE